MRSAYSKFENVAAVALPLALVMSVALAASDAGDAKPSAAAKTYVWLFVPAQCEASLLQRFDLGDSVCLKLLLVRVLNIAITSLAWVLKAPQAIKIMKSGSVAGLSPTSMYLEVITFQITAVTSWVHGYEFASYGEAVAIWLQNLSLVFMLWAFDGERYSTAHRLGVIAVVAGATVPMLAYPDLVQSLTVPVTLYSRLDQIWANFRAGHTGQLALVTLLMNWGGAMARIFTSLSGGIAMVYIVGYAVGAACSAVLLLQVFWYWGATNAYTAKVAAARAKKKGE